MLKYMQTHLSPNQKLYVIGAFTEQLTNTCWFVEGNHGPEPDPVFSCNGEEADTMIWLHATKTHCSKITVLSADTDVYMIGLPLQCSLDKDIIVQVSNINSRERKLLSLKNMIVAIQNDPDLATVTEATRLKVIQALFVVTGCDYVSFFSGMGKATFLRYFFQHAEFITGYTQYMMGSLSHTHLCNSGYEERFMAFLRLVGTVYFRKNATAFAFDTPEPHFKSFMNSSDIEKQHEDWLQDIQQNIWDRIIFENQMVPSMGALWRHWKCSCLVLDMWKNADQNTMTVAELTSFGWHVNDGVLEIDWDSYEHNEAVKE